MLTDTVTSVVVYIIPLVTKRDTAAPDIATTEEHGPSEVFCMIQRTLDWFPLVILELILLLSAPLYYSLEAKSNNATCATPNYAYGTTLTISQEDFKHLPVRNAKFKPKILSQYPPCAPTLGFSSAYIAFYHRFIGPGASQS